MRTGKILSWVLAMAIAMAGISVSAKSKIPTAESIAARRANEMMHQIGLTDKQYKEVYKLFLKEEKLKKEYGKPDSSHRPQGGKPGMTGPGGRPQGGPANGHPQSGSGDHRGPQGGSVGGHPQGGRPPMGGPGHGGNFDGRRPGGPGAPGDPHGPGMSSQAKDPYSAAYQQKIDKKLRSILTRQQYAQWRKRHPLELW